MLGMKISMRDPEETSSPNSILELIQLDLEAAHSYSIEIATEDIEQAEEALRIGIFQRNFHAGKCTFAIPASTTEQTSRNILPPSPARLVDLSLNNRTTLTSSFITPSHPVCSNIHIGCESDRRDDATKSGNAGATGI